MKTKSFLARGTGYFLPPVGGYASEVEARTEGGAVDMRDKPLYSLQQFLAGEAPYASIAMDVGALPYGTRLIIPHLNVTFGKEIEFRVVDTGEAFRGEKLARLDVCCSTRMQSLSTDINRHLYCVAILEG